MFRSPAENLRIEVIVWKVFGLFDIESDSPFEKNMFTAWVLVSHALFIYVGFFLQVGVVFYTDSIEETCQALCVSCAYVNAASKAYIVVSNRKYIAKLLAKFDVDIFKACPDKEEIR